ncbi:MAG: branched-chain amino acid transaminase [Acidobacteria bacterium]|nr:branched-chain amino acid transaminase [Acidobacteriota bacterium]
MGFEQTKWVWHNGQMVAWDEATLHVSAHALHYGTGIFEGIRCYETASGPAVFRLDAHLDRLLASAAVYELELGYSREELTEVVGQVIERNGFASCYVRPICYFGSHSLGLHAKACPVEVAVLAWPWAPLLGAQGQQQGVRITVSPWVKFHSRMMPTTSKACGQYLNSILAVRDAYKRGFDEALLLDSDGNIAEGPGENLFLLKDGKLFTNDESSSILLGITRDAVMQLAADCGYTVAVRKLRLEDLLTADEAFFTGTAAEITPIREVDGTPLSQGRCGAVTRKLQEHFNAVVHGKNPRYHHWLHFVSAPVEKLANAAD